MTPDRWQQVKNTLAAALECPDEHSRATFLATACGDDTALRREVESLLAQSDGELESVAEVIGIASTNSLHSADTGRKVGSYELIRELGRGGMGTVWLAKRADQQFDKVVAIKLLKRGTDTEEVLRRFQTERQILARLEHSNIARLLDGGTADDGLPYFVMEYVEGQPITKYADQHRLSVSDRLNLFRVVCAAVSYAHRNLVVHRDLKPGNILVTNAGEVKLLDFGIAKVVQPAGQEFEAITVTLHRVLTPEYASPEQVRGEPVTTVSDVYALGVFLYELLTGSRPYTLKHQSADEINRAICEQEPERPSTTVAKGDGSSILHASSSRLLRGDLDNIVLKALRKNPERRYPSVDQFSEDIRRHLDGLPVRARKETPGYRASKFIQRHKLGVAAAITLVLALTGGIAATAWEAKQARAQKAVAEERFRDVRELAHSVLFDYHDAIASLPGSTAVRERLVKDSLKYLDRLAQKAGNDPSLQQELAIAYIKVGDVQSRSAAANLGDTQGSLESYRKAFAISTTMAALAPKNAENRNVLAIGHERLGEIDNLTGTPANAAEHYRQALAIFAELGAAEPADSVLQVNLAFSHRMLAQALGVPGVANLGDKTGAAEHLQKAVTIYEALPDRDFSADSHRPVELLGTSISRKYIQESLAEVYAELAALLDAMDDKPRSLESRQKSVALYEMLLARDPRNVSVRRDLAVSYGNIGVTFLNAGDTEKALARHEQALALYEALAKEDPNNLNAQKDLALGYRNMGRTLESRNRERASSYYHQTLDILERLLAKDESNAFLRRHLAYTYLRMSMLLSDGDDLSGALEQARRAISICESLIATDPKNITARNTLAVSYAQLGKSYRLIASKAAPESEQTKNWHEAKNWYGKSLEIWQDMKSKGTLNPADASKADEIAAEIAKCDAALK
jgi:serine/threonine protein kinase/tetratricopeptide (TPR) repeat protein